MIKEFFERFRNNKSSNNGNSTPTPSRDMFQELMSADTDLYVNVRPTHYNPDILAQRKGGLRYYEKMRRDDAIAACLGLKKYAVLSSGWSVEPASDDEKDIEVAEFIEDNFKNMKGILDDTLLEIMTAFDYGFSVTEKILKVDSWRKYQNRIMLKSLKTRKPHGIDFDADIHGNLLDDGIVQAKNDRFPAKKFVIYVNKQEFGNWYGESDLRNCYRAYWSKDNIIKFWNIFLERYGMPPAIGKIDGELKNESADMAAIRTILKTLQSASSVILPGNIDLEFPNTNNGQASASYKEAIAAHDMAIARSLLVPNLLGLSAQGNTGSYAQAKTQFNVFLFIILKIRRGIEELITEQLIRELVDYNYTVENYPKFVFDPMEDDTKLELVKMFLEAVKLSALIPDHEDQNVLRKILGWPEKEEEDIEEVGPETPETPEPPKEPSEPTSPKAKTPEETKPKDELPEEATEKETTKHIQKEFALTRPKTRFEKKIDFVRIDKELTRLETDSTERVMDVLVKQRDHIADFLLKRLEAGTVTMKLINSLQLKFGRELQQNIREMLREAYTLGRDSSATEVKTKSYQKLPPTQAIEWFSQQSFTIKGVLDGAISNKVKQTLIQGLEGGEPTAEIIQKIRRVYDPYIGTRERIANEAIIRPYRTETLVRTNLIGAYNHGRLAIAFDEDLKGYIKGWEYSAIMDDRTTDICMRLDGQIIRQGDPALYRLVPPKHFNCRSMLVPVTLDEEPFDSISRAETDSILQLIPESFGGTVGGPRPIAVTKPKGLAAKRQLIKQLSDGLKTSKQTNVEYYDRLDEKNDYLLKQQKDWFKNLDAKETAGIDYYTGTGYKNVNGALRGKINITTEIQNKIDSLDLALNKATMPEEIVVYRKFGPKMTEKLLSLKEGSIFSDKAYISTSLQGGNTANKFTIGEIYIPKESKAAAISKLSTREAELEILIHRDSKFRILGTRKVNKATLIQMELI